MENYYKSALSFIHDKYYGDIARLAAGEIILKRKNNAYSKVIDLGCGSGILAALLNENHMDVLGVDISADMLDLARKNAPDSTFVQSSIFDFEFEHADVISAIGEPFNYLFDHQSSYDSLAAIFKRIKQHLNPDGFFLFDILCNGVENKNPHRVIENDDYNMKLDIEIDEASKYLTRTIKFTMKDFGEEKEDIEIHRQLLFDVHQVERLLREIGFQVETWNHYGELSLRTGHEAFYCIPEED